ncbi:16S rRNA (cytidine(1402)-2'-O)-methyltransferase [Enterococcus sp. BWT-B8]|uniref:16S rRNA (cytidine(1402)-2'-O)-methyltransferase n=1 Tax=Enterococcus sp. BWT-B8 TaxID=2885157 RepID=UPI001E4870B0|nr:16S rRNA (cytidine(1402)-2'-O)-methyltransferase [Enterococcus sp. BWT-B8]MCB5952234.1 16S rRNA (cytidine(1402)-2'-O)-methyltransferase [Enterococcus sp. BWT-B8]
MKKQKSYTQEAQGKLFLVPTPIGNLEDMTFRSIRSLKEADLIASEDTRTTKKLLNHFEIDTPQMSFHEHNYKERIPVLLERLLSGETIAQVSDAGMPSISDPGHELVVACIKAQISVIALPGASAGITALIASGILPQPFTFYGFLPRKGKEQRAALDKLKYLVPAQIFYESPHRVLATLKNMQEIYGGERQAVLCRELTKLHEEYLRGTVSELIRYLEEQSVKGECCLIISGGEEPEETVDFPDSVKEHVEGLISTGLTSKEAVKEAAKLRGMKKQDVYKAYHVGEE